MANLFRLIVLLCMLAPMAGHAAPKVKQYSPSIVSPPEWFNSGPAACGRVLAKRNETIVAGQSYANGSPLFDESIPACNHVFVQGQDRIDVQTQLLVREVCPAGTTERPGGDCTDPVCRADQVPDGAGGCTCAQGSSESGGKCVPGGGPKTDDQKCADAALLHNSIGTDRIGRISGKHPLGKEVQVCRDSGAVGNSGQALGCSHSFTGESSFQKPGGWVTEGESWANTDSSAGNGVGLACALGLDKDPNKPEDADKVPEEKKPPEGCRNGYAGSVNGVDVCIDRASGEQNGVNFTRVTDGNGSQSDLRTSVTCVRDVCTVTETKTPIGRSGSPTTTTTSNVDRAQFCRSNGSNPVCGAPTGSSTKPSGTTGGGSGNGNSGGGDGDGEDEGDKSNFGGSCSAGFTCKGDAKGDAIQCAMAREQHVRACKLFDDKTPESELYDAEKAKDRNRDVTKDLPGNQTIDLAGKLSNADLLGGAQCISDLSVTVWHTDVSLPLSKICPALGYLGWVLVSVASLVAFRIVSGTPKET